MRSHRREELLEVLGRNFPRLFYSHEHISYEYQQLLAVYRGIWSQRRGHHFRVDLGVDLIRTAGVDEASRPHGDAISSVGGKLAGSIFPLSSFLKETSRQRFRSTLAFRPCSEVVRKELRARMRRSGERQQHHCNEVELSHPGFY